jgi:transcriptional regulator of arginine metabolism
MHKSNRQQKIISLIRTRRIGTQQELTAMLERAGFVATQSSISRDLEALGVVKHDGHYTLPRTTGAASRGLLALDAAGDCLVVAKCEPGLASAVAVEIDRAGIPEIVGTLAGEDTVFIAVQERKAQRVVIKNLLELFDEASSRQ